MEALRHPAGDKRSASYISQNAPATAHEDQRNAILVGSFIIMMALPYLVTWDIAFLGFGPDAD